MLAIFSPIIATTPTLLAYWALAVTITLPLNVRTFDKKIRLYIIILIIILIIL